MTPFERLTRLFMGNLIGSFFKKLKIAFLLITYEHILILEKVTFLQIYWNCTLIYRYEWAIECETLKILNERFTFKKLRHRVAKIIRTCDLCQTCKFDNIENFAPMQNIIPDFPQDLNCINYVRPLPRSNFGCEYILTIMDAFTKYIVLYPIKKATTPPLQSIVWTSILKIWSTKEIANG